MSRTNIVGVAGMVARYAFLSRGSEHASTDMSGTRQDISI